MDPVEDWLTSLGLAEYAPRFAENRIRFGVLRELTEQDLKDLGVQAIGDRRLLKLAIADLAQKACEAGGGATGASAGAAKTTDADGRPSGKRASAAERRHLTVMFCDLVGSTALAARLDPEDVREVVRAYQGACARVIGKYEGFVAQYLGDGVLAYFGYPAAHEDDAERAVRAGLDLIGAVAQLDTKSKVGVRIGIATGLVVVGDLIGEHAAKERAVTGETPNLAARLQGLASPGSIVVSAATRRLLGRMFDLRDLGAQSVKGLDAPVQAFSVEGVRTFESRFEARVGGLTGFVGREEEGEHLLERKKFAWQGRGQVVLVSGEAGIGKSRLTAWLVDEIGAEPHTRLRYQCTPHHRDSALYPTIAHIERAAGIEAIEPPESKLAKLEAMLGWAKADAAATVPLFAALLAIPCGEMYPPLAMSPGEQRQRTMAAMLDQIEGLAKQKALLMIYEDAHWADATSLELLDATVDRIARLPVLLIVTGRPEFSPAWAGRHNVSTLALQKLDKRHTRAMVENVTGGAALPVEVLEQIVAKTDGVPLFVEELTKTVLESGAVQTDGLPAAGPLPSITIPATLQDSLMARLDRSNPVKEIAQVGAAIGREFSYKLLVAAAGMDEATLRTGLAKLEEAELATRRGVPPDATYTFKHALVQDAAYESLLKSRRQVIHRRIAKALRDQFPLLAETEPEILAHHFTQAGRSEQGVDWWTKAGELALKRSAYLEANGHLERALTLATQLSESAETLHLQARLHHALGNASLAIRGYSAAETRSAFQKAYELFAKTGDIKDAMTCVWGVWVSHFIGGDIHSAKELALSFMSKAEAFQESTELMMGRSMLGRSCWAAGDFIYGRTQLELALSDYRPERDGYLTTKIGNDHAVVSSGFLCNILWPLGDFVGARRHADAAVERATQTNHLNSIVVAHMLTAWLSAVRSDPDEMIEHGELLTGLGRTHGLQQCLATGQMSRGWGSWRKHGRSAEEDEFLEGCAFFDRMNGVLFQPVCELLRSHLAVEPAEALLVIAKELESTRASGQQWFDAERHRRCGEILRRAAPNDLAACEAAFMRALTVSKSRHTRTFELRASLDLARLYCDTGRGRDARHLLAPALVGFTETAELPEIGEAQRLLASLGGTLPGAPGAPGN